MDGHVFRLCTGNTVVHVHRISMYRKHDFVFRCHPFTFLHNDDPIINKIVKEEMYYSTVG